MHTEHFSPGNRLFLSNMSTERSNMASTGDDSDQAIWKPSPLSPDSWKTWTYAEWNERLLEYCLARHDGADGTPVTRIAATPEELTLVVGDDSAAPEAVAERFVEVIRQELPPGRSFSGYCRDYVSYARQSKNPWTPESRDSPHFFAMLWFTRVSSRTDIRMRAKVFTIGSPTFSHSHTNMTGTSSPKSWPKQDWLAPNLPFR